MSFQSVSLCTTGVVAGPSHCYSYNPKLANTDILFNRHKHAISAPVFLQKNKQLLLLPEHPQEVHKIWGRLVLLACLLSGDRSLDVYFQKQLQTSLCLPGEPKQIKNTTATYNIGRFSVVNGKLIPFLLL